MKMTALKPYGKKLRLHPPLGGETMTKQSFKDECDINNILKKYQSTGLISHVASQGRYINLPPALDYHEATNLCLEAQKSFDGLPSSVRREFANDPGEFLSFVDDPKNVDRMEELGLLRKDFTKAPSEADTMASAAASAPPGDTQEGAAKSD